MKRLVSLTILVLIVYAFIHNPILTITGGIGIIKFLYPIAFVFFLLNTHACTKLFQKYSREFISLFLILFFSLFRGLVGGDFVLAYSHLILLIECFILPCVFAVYWISKGRTTQDLIKLLLLVSAIASLISTLCVVIPSFGTFVRFELQVTPQDSYLADALFRGFGISEELTSGYGYIQAICFVFGLRYINESKWYVLFMPMVILSIILSARTGIIIVALGIILHFFTLKKPGMALSSILVFSILIVFAISFFNWLDLSEDSLNYIQGFFDETTEIGESRDLTASTTTNALFNDMIILPRDFGEWIIGRGYSIFYAKTDNSDVGYIIQLNYGGLIYVLLWFIFLFKLFSNMKRKCFDKFMPLFLFISILILNLKGNTLSNGSVMRFVMLIYFIVCSEFQVNYTFSRKSGIIQ